jgi:structural maintenance of chromosomes protein 5
MSLCCFPLQNFSSLTIANFNSFDRQALVDKKETFNKVKEEATRAHKKFNEIKMEVQQKKKEAEELAPLTDENGDPTPLKAMMEDLQANEIHEIDAAMEEAERLLSQYDANPEVIRQYQILKAEIEKIEDQLANSTETRERNFQAIDEMRKDWETRLEVHLFKINILFGQYMQEMGCTGEVRLSKGPKPEDGANERPNFKLWGVEILVSFRDGAKAQILSAQRHSGGERSVSTILYLMALQDMMVAPFRCVDEINQGLDDRNERLVFRRIVSNSTRRPKQSPTDHAGQYWLITPKVSRPLFVVQGQRSVFCLHFASFAHSSFPT